MTVNDFLGILDFSKINYIRIDNTTFCVDKNSEIVMRDSIDALHGDDKINHLEVETDIYGCKGVFIVEG